MQVSLMQELPAFEMLLTGEMAKMAVAAVAGHSVERDRAAKKSRAGMTKPPNTQPSTWLQLQMWLSQRQMGLFEPVPSLLERAQICSLIPKWGAPSTEAPGLWWPLGSGMSRSSRAYTSKVVLDGVR